MDVEDFNRRRQDIAEEVKRRQEAAGHESPIPSFNNLITDLVIAFDERQRQFDERLQALESNSDSTTVEEPGDLT